ncbi:MAG: carboxypeptidase-like regulatory domain-containing protein, partial [Planctomycetota bacterium]|nr:carboxypeptidase-like regulatory domain-containing protein [Planctomycetota bacterium]
MLHGLSVRDPPRLELSKHGYRVVGQNSLTFAAGERRTAISILLRAEPTEEKGDEKPYAFTGRVVDGTGKPLEGVSVRWSEKRYPNTRHETTRTDTEGKYKLGVNKTGGDRQLSAFGKGWAARYANQVTPGPVEEPVQVDFTMARGRRVEAVVVDESGSPVSGVMVCPLLEGKEWHDQREIPGQPSRMKPKTTDADGLVRMDGLPDGDVFLKLWRHGFTDIDQFDVDSDAEMRIEMKAAGVIKVQVVDKETGTAIPGFTAKVGGYGISVSRSDPGQRFSTADGRFVIGELNQGRSYRVTIEAPGYPPSSEKRFGAHAPDVDREEVIRLVRAARLSGVVTSAESGRPVPGVSVALAVTEHGMCEWSRLRDGSRPGYEHVTLIETDEAGAFEVEEGEAARTFFIRRPGFARRVVRPEDRRLFMKKGAPGLTIPLEPAAVLAGAVFRRGEVLPDARIYLARLSRPGAPFMETMESIRTDASGEYRVEDLAAGTYRISVYERKDTIGFAWIQRSIDLVNGQERELRIGHDLGPLVLHGRVLGTDGEPVEHARVRVTPKFSWHYGKLVTYTGRDGRYRLDGLRAGSYAASASKSFFPPRGTYYTLEAHDTLDVSSDTERDFAFRKQHKITARIDLGAGLASSSPVSFNRAYLNRADDGMIKS